MADDNPGEASSAKPQGKPVNCNICNKSFPHKGSLRRHRQSKHAVKKDEAHTSEPGQDGEAASTFDCVLCQQTFPRQSSLTQHQRSKHGPPKPEAPDTSTTQTQTQAAEPQPEANDASTSAKQEDVKQDNKSQESKTTCSICNRSFGHRGALYQHKRTKHRTVKTDTDTPAKEDDKTPDAEEKTIKCDVCDKSFTSRNSLRRHLKSKHTSDKKGKGPAKSSAQDGNAAGSSKQVHTTLKERHNVGSQKFKCICCNESFPSEDTLMKHQAEQRQEAMRQVMENMAQVAFGMRVSNGQDGSDEEGEEQEPIEETAAEEKKVANMHQCTLCDKSFRFKSALVQHGLIKHAVADDTVAESSGQGASATAGGKKAGDVDEDDEDKPYCQTCQKTFRHAKGLTDHKLNKHGIVEAEPTDSKQGVPENPTFRCRLCNKTFRLATALRQHQRDSHPEMHRPRYSEDDIMRQLLRMAVPPFGRDGDDDDDDYEDEDEDYEDYEDEDDPFSYPGHGGFGRHQFDFPAGIQPGDIYDSDDPGYGYPGFSDDDDDDDSEFGMENDRGPPTLCTHCNENFPQMALVAHQWHVHGISHPAVVDVQAKIAKDESYGPKRTVCTGYPNAKEFPFFFEIKYFLRDCQFSCGQSFETGTERMKHEVEAHNRCITCETYFQTRATLENHQAKSKVVDTVVRDFDHWLEFAVPAQVHHEKQKAKAARNPGKNIDCIICERKFDKASTMMKHVENGRCIPGVNEMDIFVLGQKFAEAGASCTRISSTQKTRDPAPVYAFFVAYADKEMED
ncbi:zinc finger double-stranded RNA binding protein [Fusarium mexicanum]|uniref:Zinc finger double-stranded RNA binding protein n=1 Tax=Fusarium mexicanum TaxID=751941 RepID=A0A8H5IPP0_9HYPO|nr:zinc finger double-stranded RNA binding protein [Fusarium mexicanum]